MTTDLILPKFNMDMEGAVLLRWLRAEGDRVELGEPVAEVETDKVNMEVEATADGFLFDLRYAEGDTVPVTMTIARIAEDEAAMAQAQRASGPASRQHAPAPEDGSEPGPATQPAAATSEEPSDAQAVIEVPSAGASAMVHAAAVLGGKVRATPAVRRLAREHGIDITTLGTRASRVSADQVRAAIDEGRRNGPTPQSTTTRSFPPAAVRDSPAAPPPPTTLNAPPAAAGGVPLDATRRAIAARMMEAKDVPQITLYVEVRGGPLSRVREQASVRPSFSAIFAVAVARALRDHPQLNTTFEGGLIVAHPGVDLGIAVARPEGLIVPVLRDADRLHVSAADVRIRDLVARGREGRLRLDDVTGGSFTITSLGEAGIDSFAPLLNPPQVAILGIGRLAPRVVADNDGIRVEPTVHLSLTCDHRVIDGAPGAAFLATLRGLLERPDWLAASILAT